MKNIASSIAASTSHALSRLIPTSTQHIAVAVSGGADSMAALLLAQHWARTQQVQLSALTVDHQLRAASTDEATQVKSWCQHHTITHHILTHCGKRPTRNLQANARAIRYQLMADYCHNHSIKYLILGHHADDQAETILMRYLRGAGPEGLRGMTETSQLYGLQLIRPLLSSYKDELIGYLVEQNQTYLEDPSNQSNSYTRNRIRKALHAHPNHQQLREKLLAVGKTMAIIGQDQATARQAAGRAVTIHPMGYATMPLSKLGQQPTEINTLLLMRLLSTISGNDTAPRFAETGAMLAQLNNQSRLTFHGCILEKKHTLLYLYRELQHCAPATKQQQWDNRFTLTPVPPNHHIAALGETGWRAINRHATIDPMLPKRIFRTIPAIFADKDLETPLVVPHIDYRNPRWQLPLPRVEFTRQLHL